MNHLRATTTLLLLASLVRGEGTTPRRPEGYPARTALGGGNMGAECLLRTFGEPPQTFLVDDYLVVEVALFPAPATRPVLSMSQFTLRLDGKTLFPQAPSMVAASLKYADWESRPRFTTEAGVGDARVILGRPPLTERFPGDPTVRQQRLPAPPRVPDATPKADGTPAPSGPELAVQLALPEGAVAGPVSGYLYFAFRGKPKKIREMTLLYNGPLGKATLPLR